MYILANHRFYTKNALYKMVKKSKTFKQIISNLNQVIELISLPVY